MQPLQHDLQCPAAKDNTIMHVAAAPSHLDAAITLRSASTDFKRAYRTTTRCRTSRENQCDVETIAAAPAAHTHTNTHEVPFIAGCMHFTRKNARFRAPAASPKQAPCNIHAAITASHHPSSSPLRHPSSDVLLCDVF